MRRAVAFQRTRPRRRSSDGPPGLEGERARRVGAGGEAEPDAPRRVVHVEEGEPDEDLPHRLGEERHRDEEAREELEDEVLGAQDAEDRRGADGDEADAEVDRADEEGREEPGEEEEAEGRRARRREDRVDEAEEDADGEREEDEAEGALAERLRERHRLDVDGLDERHGEAPLADLARDLAVDLVEVEAAQRPPRRDVGEHLREGEAAERGAVALLVEEGAPDVVPDGGVEEVGQDADEVARAVGEEVQERGAREGEVGAREGEGGRPGHLCVRRLSPGGRRGGRRRRARRPRRGRRRRACGARRSRGRCGRRPPRCRARRRRGRGRGGRGRPRGGRRRWRPRACRRRSGTGPGERRAARHGPTASSAGSPAGIGFRSKRMRASGRCRSRRPRRLPSQRTWPWSMRTTRSQSSSMSSRSCVVRMTVVERRLLASLRNERTFALATTSRPMVGSSRKRSVGSWRSEAARSQRIRSPRESFRTGCGRRRPTSRRSSKTFIRRA